jgi:hypothetical protein
MAVSLLQSDIRQKIEEEHKYFLVLLFGLSDVLEINTSRLKSGRARESSQSGREVLI